MITNSIITIYNRLYSESDRTTKWKKTVIKGVWAYRSPTVSMLEAGVRAADVYKIRIPMSQCEGYVPAAQYTGQDNTFTVRTEDYIAIGERDDITDVRELKKQKEDTFQITSYSVNDFGNNKHIRITGA